MTPAPPATAPIPVSVLTGFLGSGKTTLLAKLLAHPSFSRTAVIINEFGAVGLDHDLVRTSDESFVELKTGCLCCTIRSDLVETLGELLARRDAGTVPPFERIVIETSGLADPAPVLQAIMTDTQTIDRLTLAGVVTTVDAVNGMATLDQQPESVKQAAVADRIVITKTDLAHVSRMALEARLAALNPSAPMIAASFGDTDAEALFDATPWDIGRKTADVARWLDAAQTPDTTPHHDHGIAFHAIVRETPIAAIALTLLFEALAEHAGDRLLRMKGIVEITERAGKPAIVHGVQHVFHPPVWLEAWPSDDRRTRLVFITRGLSGAWIDALLGAIESEVAEVGEARETA